MFESPEGGGPNLAVLGGAVPTVGGGVALEEGGADTTRPPRSTDRVAALRAQGALPPDRARAAAKLAAREPLPKFLNATPLSLMNNYSDAHGAFHPAPTPPRPHRSPPPRARRPKAPPRRLWAPSHPAPSRRCARPSAARGERAGAAVVG